ncbi:hypothetical protein SAMN02745136_04763 [Anaerocolumna jejuensis DSM 15929]|uniref:DUF5710 domain-containing protein n=1 Tax=Anaerocolumna jejuensis DSM 15929 TaxID=1121322 RepID=A0A1M7A6C8_9FIRM|nr:DUF5710 domain-containing protein [Anaerocolumna jejuensis]SHL38183.1 hypothetical protein SAMN02745136_04763 [Anaerocolumna jejuensis DSM 15929]
MIYLDVPFQEKDEAKQLGAWWDAERKKWYVRNQKDYPKFLKWILKDEEEVYILCDHFYIVVGTRKCYKCGKDTEVVAFGVEKYCTLIDETVFANVDQNFEWSDNEIHIASMISPISEEILSFLCDKYGFHMGYSHAVQDSYMANHCSHCKALQGQFFLYEEVDSPFFIDSREKAQALKLYKVKLEHDIVTEADIGWSSADSLIKKFAQIQDFQMK